MFRLLRGFDFDGKFIKSRFACVRLLSFKSSGIIKHIKLNNFEKIKKEEKFPHFSLSNDNQRLLGHRIICFKISFKSLRVLERRKERTSDIDSKLFEKEQDKLNMFIVFSSSLFSYSSTVVFDVVVRCPLSRSFGGWRLNIDDNINRLFYGFGVRIKIIFQRLRCRGFDFFNFFKS